jgi:hypothetical protein
MAARHNDFARGDCLWPADRHIVCLQQTSPPTLSVKKTTKHLDTNEVDSFDRIRSDLVQFARLAAAGDSEGAKVFGMRRVRELMKSDPALAHGLRSALVAAPKAGLEPASSLRRAEPTWESTPADADSGIDLLRVEPSPKPSVLPLYAPHVEHALSAIVAEHQSPEALLEVGLTPTKTLLLSGPPGVGKTLAATWLAQKLGHPLLVLDLGTVMSRFLGATGANLKRAIGFALRNDGILLLDELDALAKRRDDSTDVGELKRLVTVLLQELDDWPTGRLLIGATNHPQLLDNAVWRRFEARIDFPRPGAAELRTLMGTLTPSGVAIPEIWRAALPAILANTSHSEFVRTFAQLRKFAVLNPLASPIEALIRLTRDRMELISRNDAKAIALSLAKEATLSLRQISEFTHVSRDTMRRAGIKAK